MTGPMTPDPPDAVRALPPTGALVLAFSHPTAAAPPLRQPRAEGDPGPTLATSLVRFPRSLGDKLQALALTNPERLIALELMVDELIRLDAEAASKATED